MLNKSLVADYPRFGYRSLMIDTVRHYLPLPVLQDITVSLLLWPPAINIFVMHTVCTCTYVYSTDGGSNFH